MPSLDKKHVNAGRSIIQILWEELDSIMDRLKSDLPPDADEHYIGQDEFNTETFEEDVLKYGEERGQAQGVAYAIAVINNPYDVNVSAVKAMAVERWESRNEES